MGTDMLYECQKAMVVCYCIAGLLNTPLLVSYSSHQDIQFTREYAARNFEEC